MNSFEARGSCDQLTPKRRRRALAYLSVRARGGSFRSVSGTRSKMCHESKLLKASIPHSTHDGGPTSTIRLVVRALAEHADLSVANAFSFCRSLYFGGRVMRINPPRNDFALEGFPPLVFSSQVSNAAVVLNGGRFFDVTTSPRNWLIEVARLRFIRGTK